MRFHHFSGCSTVTSNHNSETHIERRKGLLNTTSLPPVVPRQRDDLRVEGEGDAERRHQDVAQTEVEQEVVAGGARPPRAQPAHDEEQVQQDGQHYRHDVQRDPAPLVLLRQLVLRPAVNDVDEARVRVRDAARRAVEGVFCGVHHLKKQRGIESVSECRCEIKAEHSISSTLSTSSRVSVREVAYCVRLCSALFFSRFTSWSMFFFVRMFTESSKQRRVRIRRSSSNLQAFIPFILPSLPSFRSLSPHGGPPQKQSVRAIVADCRSRT